MSTRRTTRAASRQAESRGASPAPTDMTGAASTPRRPRRAGNALLPATATRQSTAYGTNTLADPRRVMLPPVTAQVDSILNSMQQPRPSSASSKPKTLLRIVTFANE
jgi:hypothetical protein